MLRSGRLLLAPSTVALALLLPLLPLLPTATAGPSESLGVAAAQVTQRRVLAISVDGLHPGALRKLGRRRVPHLLRLIRRGAATRNARTQIERTVTLPNHVSMVTGRRIDRRRGGHGVTWNRDRSDVTVHEAAGERVESVFSTVHRGGGSTAVFATKSKFTLLKRSWPGAIDRSVIKPGRDGAVVRRVRKDLVRHHRSFTFLHLGKPDRVGHRRRWLSRAYLDAVVRVDRLVGSIMRTRREHRRLRRHLVIVLTSDHGGVPGTRHHGDPRRRHNYRVPFAIWGRGIDRGGLYRMNPDYRNPRKKRVGATGAQPVRNGDVANLSTRLLGLGTVPGSRWGAADPLRWHR